MILKVMHCLSTGLTLTEQGYMLHDDHRGKGRTQVRFLFEKNMLHPLNEHGIYTKPKSHAFFWIVFISLLFFVLMWFLGNLTA